MSRSGQPRPQETGNHLLPLRTRIEPAGVALLRGGGTTAALVPPTLSVVAAFLDFLDFLALLAAFLAAFRAAFALLAESSSIAVPSAQQATQSFSVSSITHLHEWRAFSGSGVTVCSSTTR
eukprot:COSAG03_NODE_2522_length_2677_cov_3.799845_1_plen_121_part_00